ncbi:MAG: GNAT family N-acetyltransferase [Propionibacteriaceae bacterium]|nr:GNAT family N-acetyltransferase [Propionibacteriaceae bacterium]
MHYSIRPLRDTEHALLDDFLYEAIFVPEGVEAPPRSIIEHPQLRVYTEDFGREDDHCLVAEADGGVVGAVWVRIMDDFGHIAPDVPSLSIALYEQYRGWGIGTALLEAMLDLLRERGYERVSLSVQKKNAAHRLYLRCGFRPVRETDEEYVMACDLRPA